MRCHSNTFKGTRCIRDSKINNLCTQHHKQYGGADPSKSWVMNNRVTIPAECLKGYEIINIIGRGIGIVAKACDIENNCNYAVKFLEYDQDNEAIITEANISKLLSDEGIGPKFIGSWICERAKVGIIVTELWDGSLLKFRTLQKPRPCRAIKVSFPLYHPLNDKVSDSCELELPKAILDKLLQEIYTMHDLGLVHRDIYARNILVKLHHNKIDQVIDDATIADFGMAVPISEIQSGKINIRFIPKSDDYLEYLTDILNMAAKKHKQHLSLDGVFVDKPTLIDYDYLWDISSHAPAIRQKLKDKVRSETEEAIVLQLSRHIRS